MNSKLPAILHSTGKHWLCLPALLCICCGMHAQTVRTDSLDAWRDKRTIDHYSFSRNAATLATGNRPGYGYASATAGLLSGDFRRPMEPSRRSILTLSTGGYRKIDNWNLTADFQYQKIFDNDLAWTAVNDPYGGNPFTWADSSSGPWDRDHIRATIGAARKISRAINAGLLIDYGVGTGARTSEPKPFYRVRDIALQPGFVYKLSGSADIGISGNIGFTQEDNEIGHYSNSNVLLYRLRGYGTFSKSPFVSGERKKKGTVLQGSLQYQKQWQKLHLLIAGSLSQTDEEVFEGVARTQAIGYFTGINYAGKLRLFSGTAMEGKLLEFVYENRNGYGDDIIFRAENASFIRHTAQAELSFWKQREGGNHLLQYSLLPSICYMDYADQAAYMQWTATHAGVVAALNYRKNGGKKIKWQWRPSVGYFHVVDDFFTTRSNQLVMRELVVPDYNFFSTGYWKTACRLELEIKSNNPQQSHLIALTGDARLAGGEDFSNRIFYQLQYSILF